ncbi:MAG: hypothetical protein HY923_10955 [Elusimicrobia bacterium]|nr:hypothetical protein [Elusimicrobiota bacterium]
MRIAALAALLALSSSCKKAPAPAPVKSEAAATLPMPATRQSKAAGEADMQRELEKQYPGNPAKQKAMLNLMNALGAQGDEEKRLAEINQRTMVLPASPDFKPEPVARKIRLTLVLEKTKIRTGENPRFRLELTNVGRETIDYQENQSSIFRWGGIGYSMRTIHFYLTDRKGKRLDLFPALGRGRVAPVQYNTPPMSDKEMLESNARGLAANSFKVRLLPGATLRSLGDGDTAQEPFRTLLVEEGYEKPGTYRLQVELDDRPSPLSPAIIKVALKHRTLEQIHESYARKAKDALGPVSSNAVTFEVAR